MRPDVCMKQRLYDEFLEEMQEACVAMLTGEAEWLVLTAGLPKYTEADRQARIARPIYIAIPQFTITVNVEL